MRNLNKSEWALASIVVAGIVLICFVGFALYGVFHFPLGFGSVSVLLLVGIAAFIGIMNLLSVSSHLIGITNAAQPFGLPEGTVRAILTIAFIVLVGVLASFLLTNSSGREPFGDPIVMRGIAAKDADSIVQRLLPDSLASIERSTGDKVDIQVRPKRDYRLADDVAKQILTMLSTILAAMIGFYFGAQTPGALPQSGRTNESDKRTPTLTSIDPSTLTADGTPQTLVITGTNLNKVQTVSIENESTRSRNATSFKVDSAEQVTAVFTLNSNTPAGDWVVVVSDGDTTARLPGNLKIGA